MKSNKLYILTGLVLTSLYLISCRSLQGVFHKAVEGTTAPTAIPLYTAVSTSTPPATPIATQPTLEATPESTPTPEPPAVVIPTRIIPPQDTINLPPGFGISVYAQGLRSPRMMAVDSEGVLYAAERSAGRIIRLPDNDQDGVADAIENVADDLSSPSSIAFHKDGTLYVGETTRVIQLSDPDGDGIFQLQKVVVDGLPSGGHSTRTVLFSPDGHYLYVSVGSSCNVCNEDDGRRAAIVRYLPDGSDETVFAFGLRNAVGISFRSGTDELWVTNNGRDWLGDDQPPETVYRVEQGDDAGWPRCHSGRIEDPDYGQPGSCEGVLSPVVEIQAHSAPLGLTFYTGSQFPETYKGDLFVAFHGSWNRTTPTGYKVVRISIENGTPGVVQDFAVGWLRTDGSQWGRPVDVITGSDGSLFISDDGGGMIYRVFSTGESR